jgi:cation diffusion facilitator family transporter
MQNNAESRYKLRSLKRSTIAITLVVFVEVILGSAVGSLAIISDGLHALLDAVTTLILFLATKASLKPPDEEHMYGHEKFEAIGGLVGGLALVCIAILVLYEAIMKIIRNLPINFGLEYIGFIAIGYTFATDFFRVGTLFRARESKSSTMKAGFYHAIADLSSTLIAFVGFGLATLGFLYGDALASMVLSFLLSYLSINLVWSSGMELSDTISKDVADKVREAMLSTKGVYDVDDLRIRRAGDRTFVRATVEVPDYLDLEAAHDVTSQIEANVKNAIGDSEIVLHTHPFRMEMPTESLVGKLSEEVKGVIGTHEINVAYANRKLYISLHAYVEPDLSIEKAHEIAEKIEARVRKQVKDIENVTVHIEPFQASLQKGSKTDEAEVRKIIHKTAGSLNEALNVKRIVTYVADNKRHINIDCSFTKQISIEEAHDVASVIEEKVKSHFVETIVTVHMESE